MEESSDVDKFACCICENSSFQKTPEFVSTYIVRYSLDIIVVGMNLCCVVTWTSVCKFGFMCTKAYLYKTEM